MGIPAFYHWLIERCPLAKAKATGSNPDGFAFDNLYIDLNGIIHPCFHPERWCAPRSYDQVFISVFKYIDRIFSLIRPQKLLYLAVDGVAPRAKMNQQRARRFRKAKDAADAAFMLEKKGGSCTEKDKSSESKFLDPNLITPGTRFMELLSTALQYYIHLRMNNDPHWKGIKVILSDSSVPGEGEHKIMSYIRSQRNLPGFDPNTRHCLYGLDADLIILALATHEIHVSVLREWVGRATGKGRNKRRVQCQPFAKIISKQKFQFLHVWIIREYLEGILRMPDSTIPVDPERLIDDFVFMCLFVGNDFLPHVPSLEVSQGGIDLLTVVYKREFVQMGGYLTDASKVNLERVEHFVQAFGSHEDAIFKKRWQGRNSRKKRARRYRSKNNPSWISAARFVEDKVNLGDNGWKERYYANKFQAQNDDDCDRVKRHAVFKYVEGICWIMHYYYEGVCSWKWFYPYHYAPFASDFRGLDHFKVDFVLGKPFKPLDQLMAVLPATSAEALPLPYRKLMTDPSSPILDFYPTEFELDLNGRNQPWKAVSRLPFIDEDRLLTEIAKVENTLTDAERRRNTFGLDKLFIEMSHPLVERIFAFWERNKDNPKLDKAKVKTKIIPKLSGGMNGYIYISNKPIFPSDICSPIHDMSIIKMNRVLCVFYKYPAFHPHIPRPSPGVRMPEKIIGEQDLLPPPPLWHEDMGIAQSGLTSSPTSGCVAETLISEEQGILGKRSRSALKEKKPRPRKLEKKKMDST